jgi:hypothetical protein
VASALFSFFLCCQASASECVVLATVNSAPGHDLKLYYDNDPWLVGKKEMETAPSTPLVVVIVCVPRSIRFECKCAHVKCSPFTVFLIGDHTAFATAINHAAAADTFLLGTTPALHSHLPWIQARPGLFCTVLSFWIEDRP